MSEEPIARLTLRKVGQWTEARRKAIAEWLRHQADCVEKDGSNYSSTFTARYLAKPEDV